jgi:hypothetical protein
MHCLRFKPLVMRAIFAAKMRVGWAEKELNRREQTELQTAGEDAGAPAD